MVITRLIRKFKQFANSQHCKSKLIHNLFLIMLILVDLSLVELLIRQRLNSLLMALIIMIDIILPVFNIQAYIVDFRHDMLF